MRVQSDKIAYKHFMKEALEKQDHLDIIEAACKSVVIKDGKAIGVELEDGTFIESKAVVLTAGTNMTSNVLRGHTVNCFWSRRTKNSEYFIKVFA